MITLPEELFCGDAEEGAAYALGAIMAGISEEHWCAGWMSGLEYSLWNMVKGGPRKYGMGEVSEADVALLKALSDRSGGWWCWPENSDNAVFVSLEAWRKPEVDPDSNPSPSLGGGPGVRLKK